MSFNTFSFYDFLNYAFFSLTYIFYSEYIYMYIRERIVSGRQCATMHPIIIRGARSLKIPRYDDSPQPVLRGTVHAYVHTYVLSNVDLRTPKSVVIDDFAPQSSYALASLPILCMLRETTPSVTNRAASSVRCHETPSTPQRSNKFFKCGKKV